MTDEQTSTAKKGKATELSQKVAETLVALRDKNQMSQREFADRIGVSFQQYQKYEKGKDRLSLERAIALCKSLGMSLDIFMEGISSIASYGFAETEQSAFGATTLSAAERELLDLFARTPKDSREILMATARQFAK